MKLLTFIISFLLVFNLVLADDSVLNSRRSELTFHIDGEVLVDVNGAYGQANYVNTELYWFPETSLNQEVLSFNTEPEAEKLNGNVHYRWNTPDEGVLKYSLSTDLLTNSDYVKVSKYVKFPLENLDEEYIKYTEAQEIIDISDGIRETAASIASGKDDLYEVVFGLAEYSRNNVEYDLSSITVEASQKASWVLESKRGVCDELTSLFIAMARSLGIPAKFVSGISYTNIESFDSEWQAHGWAEVYFPNVGWVPFDVTYGEYGWLDSSHIKLHESIDADRTAAEFSGKGKNFALEPGKLDAYAVINSNVGRPVPSADITVEPEWNGISFGGYNVVNIILENSHDYYVSDSFRFAKVSGMEIFLPESTHFLLKPYEKKKLRYMLKVTEELDENSYYGFPLQLTTDRQVSAGSSFRVEASGNYYSKEDAQSLLNLILDSEGFGNILCSPDNSFLYINQSVDINCVTSEESAQICFNEECKASTNGAHFFYNPESVGFKTLEVLMKKDDEVVGSSFFSVEVLPPATIKLIDLGLENLDYSEEDNLVIKFENDVNLLSLNISIESENLKINQPLYDIEAGTHELKYLVKGSDLLPGENLFKYKLEYLDKKGRVYLKEAESTTTLSGSPWHHKMFAWFVRLFS